MMYAFCNICRSLIDLFRGVADRVLVVAEKNKRATLRKQIDKVQGEVARRLAAPAEELARERAEAVSAGRRCRTCGLGAEECNGNCFGFWRQAGRPHAGR